MVRISISTLIYKSSRLADWMYDSLVEFTPLLKTGEAEFFFVANDPSESLVKHLNTKKYRYILLNNPVLSEEELFARGYGFPEYMNRVYKGYNAAILHSKGQLIVLVNSDHFFSPDWLENLLKYYDSSKVVTSQLVEPTHPRFSLFQYAVHGEFGNTPDNFKKEDFLKYVMKTKKTGVYPGGAYMPCLFNKSMALYCGLYPEGNIAGDSFNKIKTTGDASFFTSLSECGVQHITARDSIVYHLKEGEKDEEIVKKEENSCDVQPWSSEKTDFDCSNIIYMKENRYHLSMQPVLGHATIINSLLGNYIKDKDRIKRLKKKIKTSHIYRFARKVYKSLSR